MPFRILLMILVIGWIFIGKSESGKVESEESVGRNTVDLESLEQKPLVSDEGEESYTPDPVGISSKSQPLQTEFQPPSTIQTEMEESEIIPTTEADTKEDFLDTENEEEGELILWKLLGSVGKTKENSEEEVPLLTTTVPTASSQERLSHKIKVVVENYRRYGTVTLPDNPFPDPMFLPDVKKNFAGNPVNFTNVRLYGLSDFTVDHVNTDFDKMQVYVALLMKKLVLLGNYSLRSWFSRASGPFNVTLLNVIVGGSAELKRNDEGDFQTTDSELDMSFKDSIVDFKNTGMLATLLQSVLASAGPVLFEAVKPAVLKEINVTMKKDVNMKIQNIGKYIGDDNPLDRAVAEGRKYVKENGYDPYHLEDYVIKRESIVLNISDLWLLGLSRFYRVGEVSLLMDSGNIQANVHLATAKLFGKCKWSCHFGHFSTASELNFTIDRLQAKVLVNQSIDVKQPPILVQLDLHVGKPQIRMEKKHVLYELIEFVINSLPDLLRHIIVDALEEPIRQEAQNILNEINVEEMFEKNLPELDKMDL